MPISTTGAQQKMDSFNERNPIGTPVRYYPVKGQPEFIESKTRSEAWMLYGGFPVVMVEGKSGGLHLDHIEVIES